MKDRAEGRVISAAQHCKMLHVEDRQLINPSQGHVIRFGEEISLSGSDELPLGNKYCLSRHKWGSGPSGNKIFPSGNREFPLEEPVVCLDSQIIPSGEILSIGKV